MRLLDRYLLRELAWPFIYCLAGLLVFWIGFDLLSELDEYRRRGLTNREIGLFYLWKSPEYLILLLPIVFLLSLLYAVNNHARHHELTAMRAAGISLWRAAAPYFAISLLLALALFYLNEFKVPPNTESAERLLRKNDPNSDRNWHRNMTLKNDRDRRLWHADAYHHQSTEMKKPVLLWELPDGSRREIRAESARFQDGTWEFRKVIDHSYEGRKDAAGVITETNLLVLGGFRETPRLIANELKIAAMNDYKVARRTQVSSRDLWEYLQLHPGLGRQQRAIIQTKLHARLALPFTCLVVVLITLPFAAASGRRNVFVGVASSIFICFAYFVLRELAHALGSGGVVPPWVAAWSANLCFGLGGWFLTARTQ